MTSKNIVKKDIVNYVYKKVGLPKQDIENIVNTIFAQTVNSLALKNKVKVNRFGSFNINYKKARTVLNPKTKEPNTIKGRYIVKFNSSRKFKTFLNEQ